VRFVGENGYPIGETPSFGPLFTGDSPVRLTPQTGIPRRGALFARVHAPLAVNPSDNRGSTMRKKVAAEDFQTNACVSCSMASLDQDALQGGMA
jgi:hypothetical protein